MTAKSQQFLNELALFYRNKGQVGVHPQHFVARINGEPVNLWDLYSSVLEMGGSLKVNLTSQWDDVYYKLFKTPPTGVNASVALRQIYQRYLTPYEKVNYSNFSNGLMDDDDEESSTATKDLAANFVIHSSFNHPHLLQLNGNSSANSGTGCANPLNRLFCSLLSGLPNEIELGLRVVTILSNSKEANWIADFKFIDVLLESCANYVCVCDEDTSDSLAEWSPKEPRKPNGERTECLCLERFWAELTNNETAFELVFESTDLKRIGRHYPHLYQKVYNRVKRLAELIKNLTFALEDHQQTGQRLSEEEQSSSQQQPGANYFNCATLNLLKFLLLLLTSDDQSFRNIGLDIFSNTACYTTNLSLDDDDQYLQIRQTIYRLCVDTVLNSSDLNSLTTCLDVLARLINQTAVEANNALILDMLDNEICIRLTELLTCQHDVPLVVAALECCLALSQHYPKVLLAQNRHLIKILLNLLNCESSQHFTEHALKKLKIMDERAKKHSMDIIRTASPALTPLSVLPNKTIAVATNNPVSAVDNETFAINWLKSAYEAKAPPTKNCSFRISDMYADYVKNCVRCGRRNVIGAPSFSHVIKKCFPSCVLAANSLVEGLVARPAPIIIKPQPQLASPILKAHLSAPPKQTPVTTTNGTSSTSTNSTSLAPNTAPITSTTSTSTLIKNLLANKLRSNSSVTSGGGTATATVTSVKPATHPIATSTSTSTNTEPSGAIKASVITCNPSNNLSKSSNSNLASATVSLASCIDSSNNINTSKATVQTVQFSTVTSSAGSNPISVLVTNSNGHLTSAISSGSLTSSTQSSSSSLSVTPISTPPQSVTSSPVLIGTPQIGTPTVSLQSSQPQQFLLVRTIFTSPQQQGLVGVNSAGPVRLILPANVFNQHRPVVTSAITMNGVSSSTASNQLATVSTSSPTSTSTAMSSTNDILLKAVLGSGIVSEPPPPPPSPVRSNAVKSSPLLNVLLDKGKLPEFSTVAAGASSGPAPVVNNLTTSLVTTSVSCVPSVSTMVNQQPKMFILTTKSPMALKSIPAIQQGHIQNQQVSQIQHLQQSVVVQQSNAMQQQLQQSIQIQNVQQLTSNQIAVTQNAVPMEVQAANVNPSPSPPQQQQQQPQQHLVQINSIPNCTQIISKEAPNGQPVTLQVNSNEVPLTNGDVAMEDSNDAPLVKSMPLVTNDLSPIKDIRKTVDDATKLINKRPNEDSNNFVVVTNKKAKPNAIINSVANTISGSPVKTTVNAGKGLKTYSNTNHVKAALPGSESSTTTTATATTVINSVITTTTGTVTEAKKPIANSVDANASSGGGSCSGSSTSSGVRPSSPKTTTVGTTIVATTTTAAVAVTASATTTLTTTNTSTKKAAKQLEFVCEWHGCKKTFARASKVYLHVHEVHVNDKVTGTMACQWGGPDGLGPGCQSQRPKLSLLTHLQDFHCSPGALHQAALRHQQMASTGATTISLPQPPPAHPGYAHNAALLAIKRHAINYVEPPTAPPITPTTPLTVNIRLTAALVLRNLCSQSSYVKKALQSFESYMCELCTVDGRDESRTIAQCLAVITESKGSGH